ncbi:MAG: 2'-5' RNA ligase [Methylococcaceae bacterium NSP1-2]|nr:RNA 2',3'-cyclic phosphodiesterase [Methylococcaceae bacterium]OYV20472.1 MAG: 2'-5' RNA ligase [Methylococcaceae bacterium NSP1-2]
MSRLFFALLPDDNTRQALQQISTALPLSSRQTLAFIGPVEDELVPKIIDITMPVRMPTISLVFDQLEYWRKAKVLCLTCSQPELAAANLVTHLSTLLAALNIKLDTRPYCPHLTLARHIREQPTAVFKPIIWDANQFALMESISSPAGVVYQPLQFWQLVQPLPNQAE